MDIDIKIPRKFTIMQEALMIRRHLEFEIDRPVQAWQWMNQTRTVPDQMDWVREEVQDGWRRCLEDYRLPLGHFADWNYCGLDDKNAAIQEGTTEVLEMIGQLEHNFLAILKDAGIMMVIASPEGRVLKVLGGNELYGSFVKHMLQNHISWRESSIGNNGIGSAAILSRPVAFQGMEHFLSLLHPFTTVGYPIIDSDGQLLAVIGLVSDHLESMRSLFAFLHLICVLINSNLPISKSPAAQERVFQQIHFRKGNTNDPAKEAGTDSDFLAPLLKKAVKLQSFNVPILVTGESGAGKDHFVNLIKNAGTRREGPLIAINCASIPHDLIESELFGYEAGSFTGARNQGKPGKFRLADKGTLFLDEIGDMSFDLQSTLLRVLETSEFTPVGGSKPVRVDVQVIAATNVQLLEAVDAGRFRRDLYYRLNGAQIQLPPLRERPDKIQLMHRLLQRELDNLPFEEKVSFSADVIELFEAHPWPGNIRQFLNVIRSTLYTAGNSHITREDLPQDFIAELNQLNTSAFAKSAQIVSATEAGQMSLADWEEYGIKTTLVECEGNITQAAKKLGITRSTLYKKMERFGLTRTGESGMLTSF